MQAKIGESLALLGWNVRVAEFRWSREFVLVDIHIDVDAAPKTVPDLAGPTAAVRHAKPDDIRLGLFTPLSVPATRHDGAAYGASVLILPDASLDAVHVNASLCMPGEIDDALLNATVSVIGTHGAVGHP